METFPLEGNGRPGRTVKGLDSLERGGVGLHKGETSSSSWLTNGSARLCCAVLVPVCIWSKSVSSQLPFVNCGPADLA